MPQTLTEDDFFSGLFAALALRGWTALSLRDQRVDRAAAAAFDDLMRRAQEEHLDVLFRIRLHSLHGDSLTFRNSVYSGAQRGMLSLDNPEYQDVRRQISQIEARRILQDVPGGERLFGDLAETFQKHYDGVPA